MAEAPGQGDEEGSITSTPLLDKSFTVWYNVYLIGEQNAYRYCVFDRGCFHWLDYSGSCLGYSPDQQVQELSLREGLPVGGAGSTESSLCPPTYNGEPRSISLL
jgi:hypothetical protein